MYATTASAPNVIGLAGRCLLLGCLAGMALLPDSSQASTITWTVSSSCHYIDCANTVLVDGVSVGSMSAGAVNVDVWNDGRTHILTMRSSSACGNNVWDDFGPLSVYLNDSVTGQQVVLGKDLIFGDDCGNILSVSIPFNLSHAVRRETAGPAGSVDEATGQLLLPAQLDFLIQDLLPVQFERSYSSAQGNDGPLGLGWSHSLDLKLHELSEGGMTYFALSPGDVRFVVPPVTALVDNDSAAGAFENAATLVGAWTNALSPTNYVGVNYAHDQNSGQGSKSALFKPSLPYAGLYEVFIAYTSGTNRASNVLITTHHADGDTSQSVDMKTGGGAWKSLGSYRFERGKSGSAEIKTTGANGYVIADAVLFRYKSYRSIDGRVLLEANAGTGGYDLHYPDGRILRFDSSNPHRLSSVEDAFGHKLLCAYGANGQLATVTTPAGKEIGFSYIQSGGQARISNISIGNQSLVDYVYTSVAADGVDGRLKLVSYPDSTGYAYSYSTLAGTGNKLLSRIEDLDGHLIEENLWGLHPLLSSPVVTTSTVGPAQLSLAYQAQWTDPSTSFAAATTLAYQVNGQAGGTYQSSFDAKGRLVQRTGNCTLCRHDIVHDRAGNQVLFTGSDGKTTLTQVDSRGNELRQSSVTVLADQPASGVEEFAGWRLDPLRWSLGSTNSKRSVLEQQDGTLHLEIGQSSFGIGSGVISKFRLQGNFDISLRYSGMAGGAQGNNFLFAVSSSGTDPFGTSAGYVACEHDENDGFRGRVKPAGSSVLTLGANEGNLWARRSVLRIVRSGNTFTTYRDGTDVMSSYTLTIPSDVYVIAYASNFSPFPAFAIQIEDILVTSGTVLSTAYPEVPGTVRTWDYANWLLPSVVTSFTGPAAFAGFARSIASDFDNPADDPAPSTPNSRPTQRMYRQTEQDYTDADHDGTPEPITRVLTYSYYGTNEADGLAGQLKTADASQAQGGATTYRHDSLGQLLSSLMPPNALLTYLTRDLYGNATEISNGSGLLQHTYSSRGAVLDDAGVP